MAIAECAECGNIFHKKGKAVVCGENCKIIRRKRKLLEYIAKHRAIKKIAEDFEKA